MRETLPPNNLVPEDYYKAKKIVSKLGLTTKKIDCCVNSCMLFYTEFTRSMDEATRKASQDEIPPPTKLDMWRETVGVKKRKDLWP